MATEQSVRELYNHAQSHWARHEPTVLSDFTARPALVTLCEPVAGRRVLDLGCGEGYCSRALRRRGAGEVVGLDVSEGMIEAARREEARQPLGIRFEVGDATALAWAADQSFDLVLAVFLFNYLDVAQTRQCMAEVARVLKPGGRFVFGVPHPAFPFMRRPGPPFYFEVEDAGYFSARNRVFAGHIWKRDGTPLEVRLVHKSLQDYVEALHHAGFRTLPVFQELRVTPELLELDADFFQPLDDVPLHVAMAVTR